MKIYMYGKEGNPDVTQMAFQMKNSCKKNLKIPKG
jgi:hypothetical protein